ncbi:hypothetical protein ACJX0J_042326, partial [Zea mays]
GSFVGLVRFWLSFPLVVVPLNHVGAGVALASFRSRVLRKKRYKIPRIITKDDASSKVVRNITLSLRPKETSNKDLDATACLAMFSDLEPKHEYYEVARKMLDRLQELSKKSDWKSCKPTSGARRKGCYNPDEVLAFLRSVGFSANITIYLTETWWHKGLNDLKEDFPNTYTKNKGEFLKSSNADLTRALDLEICSQSDVLIPA